MIIYNSTTNAFNFYENGAWVTGSGLAYPFEAEGTNTQINIGDEWKEIAGMQINIGDTWKEIAGMQINIGDTWKTIF